MTEIVRDIDQFKHHRYGLLAKIIPKDGTEEDTIEIGDAITELRLMKHYDEQVFPYYCITAAVSTDVASKIQACWRDARLYLTVSKFQTNGDVDEGETEELDTGDDYIKDAEFQIMVCDGAPPHVPSGQENELATKVPSVVFRMELAPVIALGINKKINNGAYHDLTISEFIAVLTADNVPDAQDYQFIMAPSDNKKRYESIFCPPLNYVPALRHLDRVYGMYAGKMTVFLDVDRGYILSSTKSTVADPESDPTTVMLEVLSPEEASADAFGTGSAYDEEKLVFRMRTAQRIQATIDGPARREVGGEHIKLVRSTPDERVGSSCKKLLIDDLGTLTGQMKEAVAWQTYDNELTVEKMRVEAREQYAPALIQFTACDLAAFQPTPQWLLVTEVERTQPLEGAWRIKAMEAVLSKAPGTNETASVVVSAMIVPSVATKDKSATTTA